MSLPAFAIPATRSDEVLLRAFVGGDSEALGELASRYENLMIGLARGMLRGRNDLARDAVQETWVRIIRWAGAYSGRSSVKTWMYKILVNCCHDVGRKADRRPPAAPDRAPPRAEVRPELDRELGALGPEHRHVILLCYHRGLTHEDAAAVLEIPVGTLKSRLHAALTRLRAALGEHA